MQDWRVLTKACACGSYSPDDAEFCGNCGAPVADAPRVITEEVGRRRRRRPPTWTRWEVTRRSGERIGAALVIIASSLAFILMYGWECHTEFVPGYPLFGVEEHCTLALEVLVIGLVLLGVGIALLAYGVHRALRE